MALPLRSLRWWVKGCVSMPSTMNRHGVVCEGARLHAQMKQARGLAEEVPWDAEKVVVP